MAYSVPSLKYPDHFCGIEIGLGCARGVCILLERTWCQYNQTEIKVIRR